LEKISLIDSFGYLLEFSWSPSQEPSRSHIGARIEPYCEKCVENYKKTYSIWKLLSANRESGKKIRVDGSDLAAQAR